ncbi:hypothetical protein SCYZ1_12 [Pseudomonas phage SCYZ1]|nr:hypothetical protein SCYZ1_12 [Pseudomonas phage SCYZ1]
MNNNTHPLTEDWRMYFNGTYIFSTSNGEPQAMLVEDVERVDGGDDRQLDGMVFSGSTFNVNGELEWARWSADIRDDFRPVSGYFDLEGNGRRNRYITYHVANRSQRKGVDSRNILTNGNASGMSGVRLARIYSQSLEMASRPGHRDFYIKEDGAVYWKGLSVGTMTDGAFTANQLHTNKEAMLWRLLQTI